MRGGEASVCRAAIFALFLAAAMLSPGAPTDADAQPAFDPSQKCAGQAEPKACVQMEGEALTTLRALWPQIPAQTRQVCEARGAAAGGSFIVTLVCVQSMAAPAPADTANDSSRRRGH